MVRRPQSLRTSSSNPIFFRYGLNPTILFSVLSLVPGPWWASRTFVEQMNESDTQGSLSQVVRHAPTCFFFEQVGLFGPWEPLGKSHTLVLLFLCVPWKSFLGLGFPVGC